MRIYGPVRPGESRTVVSALTITIVVPAVWRWQPDDWWWIGAAVALLIALLGSWGGIHLSTIVRRRAALSLRNRRAGGTAGHARRGIFSAIDVRTTVVLRVAGNPAQALPLSTIAGYLDRYGFRCAGIRVTSRDRGRSTWIALTVGATDNLTALLARSEQVPLHQAARAAQRRLADHLRELGWTVQLVDDDETFWPATWLERWRGVAVQEGHLAAYAVRVDRSLPETLARIWAFPAAATWTVLEMTGDPNRPTIAAGCALLTVDRPNGREVPDGLKPHAGDHGPALIALSPASTTPLGGSRHAGVHLDELRWPAGGFEDADRRPHLPQVAASG